jgi:hypothetical protein
MSPYTLRDLRPRGGGPKFLKTGRRTRFLVCRRALGSFGFLQGLGSFGAVLRLGFVWLCAAPRFVRC